MAIETNLFYLDFTQWFGIVIFLLLIALAIFFFVKKAFRGAGAILVFCALLLLFNEINFIISLIFMILGLMVLLLPDA